MSNGLKEPKKIIVRMPNWVGDFVMATPVLADLRAAYPDSLISALCQKNTAPLLDHNPNIDQVITCFKKRLLLRTNQESLISHLKHENYDLGVLLTNSLSSAFYFWAGGVSQRIGYATHWRRFFLTHPVPLPLNHDKQHLIQTYRQLLKCKGVKESHEDPTLFIQLSETESVSNLLKKYQIAIDNPKKKMICISPGAAYGMAKCWLPERFGELAERLAERENFHVILIGEPSAVPYINKISEGRSSKIINLAGQTSLRQLLALINASDLLVTNDSGPMHIASALKVPVVALFGSTNPVVTGPYSGGVVIQKSVSCSPCYQRVCPLDFKCMKEITTDEVYERVIHLLSTVKFNQVKV